MTTDNEQMREALRLVDAFEAAVRDHACTAHTSAEAYMGLARSNLCDAIAALSAPARRVEAVALTQERILATVANMPGGNAGFMKSWGFVQFAKALEREFCLANNLAAPKE